MAEKTIGDLQRRSREVAPLPQRRNPLQQPLTVDSICDWDSGEVQLLQGEQYTLLDNTDPHTWVVQGLGGETKRAPAACFCIPAPDPEAVARASKWVSLGIHRGRRQAGGLDRPRGVRGRCLAFAWTGGEGGGSPFPALLLRPGWLRRCRL